MAHLKLLAREAHLYVLPHVAVQLIPIFPLHHCAPHDRTVSIAPPFFWGGGGASTLIVFEVPAPDDGTLFLLVVGDN